MTMQTARDPEDDRPPTEEVRRQPLAERFRDRAPGQGADHPRRDRDAHPGPGGAAAIPSEAQPHVQRIKDLAGELKAEIDAISAIDPDLLNRMKQG